MGNPEAIISATTFRGCSEPPRSRPPIDDSVFETVVVRPKRKPAVTLPFDAATSEGRPPQPPQPERDGPDPGDELWGATVAVRQPEVVEPATPFEPKASALTLEQCARIAGLDVVDRQAAEKEREALEINESTFVDADRALRGDAVDRLGRGDDAACVTYDRVYVATLEEVRGPITDYEYARIVVASERGTLDETLAAVGLRGAMYACIERSRLRAMAEDPDHFMRMMDKVRSARKG